MSNNKKGKLNNTISQAKPVDAPVDAKTKEKKVLFRLIVHNLILDFSHLVDYIKSLLDVGFLHILKFAPFGKLN